jgi:hypothetical protein
MSDDGYQADLRRQAAERLAALDEETRSQLLRMADSVRGIEDGTIGADRAAAQRATYRLGWLTADVLPVLKSFGLYTDKEETS